MATRAKIRKNVKLAPSFQATEIWNELRCLLAQKGPKDVINWQRKGRKDRKIAC